MDGSGIGGSAPRGVAIIGIACRFPGANDWQQFWANLTAGKDSIRHFSDAELLRAGVPEKTLKRPDYVKAAPVIDDFDRFDAQFFEYSPREARIMDPQQRILLEEAWHALEDAGVDPGHAPDSRIGAYMGAGGVVTSYLLAHPSLQAGATGGLEHLANDKDFLATKLAYKLDLTGPAINVQTACSTSMVAVHLACQAILDGECEMALAGAATVRVPHVQGYLHRAGDIMSPDGRCRAYDADAEGTVFGSGCGVVVLKHVEDAIADGDRIYAVIRSSAINNDGAEKTSFTASSTPGQARAMAAAFAAAEVDPSTIGLVEGHGTGTVVGDPLEVEALQRCFATDRKTQPGGCWLGSVKTNIGHLEQAAGVASLMKTALALHHRQVPPSLNFAKSNPRINLENGAFRVATELTDWATDGHPRRAAVNSLGLGGTNAFAILEEAPKRADDQLQRPTRQMLCLSAESPQALGRLSDLWRDHIDDTDLRALGDACAAAARRPALRYRVAVTGTNAVGLSRALIAAEADQAKSGRKVAFLFPGQGSQYPGMTRAFYDGEPAFRAAFDLIADRLAGPGLDIERAIFGADEPQALAHTSLQQPTIFAVEWALARMLDAWGVRPDAVLGHSVGAFAAMAVAGIYAPQDAADLIARRAALMGALPEGGAMAAVFADAATVDALCEDTGAVVAALNSPENTVVSGSAPAVSSVIAKAEQAALSARRLTVSHAFHSPLMAEAAQPLVEFADALSAGTPTIPFVSDLTGEVVEAPPNGRYFADHLLSPVRFFDGLARLAALGCTDFIEVGPGRALRGFALAGLGAEIETHALLDDASDDWSVSTATLARLWQRGCAVDPTRFYPGRAAPAKPAPLYPFERTRFWIDDESAHQDDARALHGTEIRVPGGRRHFQGRLSVAQYPWLADHRVYGQVTLPVAAALIAMADACGEAGDQSVAIHNLTYAHACVLSEGEERLVDIELPGYGAEGDLALGSLASGGKRTWQAHIEATARITAQSPEAAEMDALRQACPDSLDTSRYYAALDHLGLNYGPGFRNLKEIWTGPGMALGRVSLDPEAVEVDASLHPALIDACLHLFPAMSGLYGDFLNLNEKDQTTFLPTTIERFSIFAPGITEVWSHCILREGEDSAEGRYTVDVRIVGTDGTPVAVIEGLTVKRLTRGEFTPRERAPVEDWLYAIEWEERPALPAPEPAETGAWIVVAEDEADVSDLTAALRDAGAMVGFLSADAMFSGSPAPAIAGPVKGVLLAAALSAAPMMRIAPSELTTLSDRQFALSQAALNLVTDALPDGWGQPRLWVVTRGAQAPRDDRLGGEAVQATLWGHGRVIAFEHPNVWGGLIDLDHGTDLTAAAREVLSADGEDQVALRDGRRFAPRLARRELDGLDLPVTPRIRPDRSYLITGGLGVLGLKLARWLADQGARHLTLVSRRAPGAEQQQAIAEIEGIGATVATRSADITDPDQVNALIGAVGKQGQPLAGIFHCAGLLDDGIMASMDRAQYHRVTAPKVEGTWALHRAAQDLNLDHFVLFSSILSLIGSMGQLNYVAGNAFQDAVVAHRRRLGLPALAMNWGPWEDAGLATESGERGRAIWRARGTRFIPADAGIEILGHALAHGFDHLGVTITDWAAFTGQFSDVPRLYARLGGGKGATRKTATVDRARIMDAIRTGSPSERTDLVAGALGQICGAALELDGVPDPSVSLREVGLDSLISITVINEIEGVFGVRLPARALLQGPSVAELAAMVLVEIPDLPDGDVAEPAPIPNRAIETGGKSGAWLVTRRPRPQARARLFCFPFAGGGSAVFDSWGDAFDPEVEVVAVEPPGRLSRINEAPVASVEDFARGLLPQLYDKLDRPYAVLGHCLGGLTLYESLRFLHARKRRMPVHIFISGARPPSVLNAPGSFEAALEKRLESFDDYRPGRPLYKQSDAVFIEIVRSFGISDSARMLEDAELRALVLPTVRAEFAMASDYAYAPQDPFPIPITVFRGERDVYFRAVDARIWRKFTSRQFEAFTRDTGHFAIVEDFDFIRDRIEEVLLRECAKSA